MRLPPPLLILLILAAALSLGKYSANASGLDLGTSSPSALCRAAITAAERSSGVPDRLMQSIGVVESGRRDGAGGVTAWPWTINAEGAGLYFGTKAEAVAAVQSLRARGVRSIDVGCMQVNLMYHADAFPSLDDAFDPLVNAQYAARFLLRLYSQTGSWPGAAAGYHSLNPEIGGPYARKVLAIWRPDQMPPPPPVMAASNQPAALPPAATGLTPGGSVAARVIPLPNAVTASAGSSVTGRGLDSYRAAPTRLASRMGSGRG